MMSVVGFCQKYLLSNQKKINSNFLSVKSTVIQGENRSTEKYLSKIEKKTGGPGNLNLIRRFIMSTNSTFQQHLESRMITPRENISSKRNFYIFFRLLKLVFYDTFLRRVPKKPQFTGLLAIAKKPKSR